MKPPPFACELLRTGGARVSEVGWRLGFENPYYFSKVFRNIVGCSPSEYKRSE